MSDTSGEVKERRSIKSFGDMIVHLLIFLSVCIVILGITTLVFGSNKYIFTSMYALSSSIILIIVSTISGISMIIRSH